MVVEHPDNSREVENIRVAVRLRPFTQRERQSQSKRIVDIEQNTVALYHPKGLSQVKKFTFDYSYWSHDGFKRDSNGLNVPDPSHPNYDKYVDQDKVFQDLGKFLLHNCIKGYNSALLAYGQTGSGKSYTVSGYGQNEGILPRFARELFDGLEATCANSDDSSPWKNDNIGDGGGRGGDTPVPSPPSTPANNLQQIRKYEIYFSMLEIYNEVVRDLLAKSHGHTVPATVPRRGLKVREHPRHSFFAEGLTSIRCHDRKEIEARIEEGQLNKSIAATSMNETSSRGHTIYKFTIKQIKLDTTNSSKKQETITSSIVQLVDLAGSERTSILTSSSSPASSSSSPAPGFGQASSQGQNQSSKSKSSQRFRESVSINQSLSALGNCIQILSQNSQQTTNEPNQTGGGSIKRHKVPYRDSALTKLLNSCCLSGNSKTVIIATLSPADMNYDDTLSTLRFADRAKQIRTHAQINEIDQAQVMHSLRKENERLKEMVDRRSHRSDDSSQTSNFDESENVVENFTGSRIGQLNSSQHRAPQSNSQHSNRSSINRRGGRGGGGGGGSNLAMTTTNRQHDKNMKKLVSPASSKMMKTATPTIAKQTMNRLNNTTTTLANSRKHNLRGSTSNLQHSSTIAASSPSSSKGTTPQPEKSISVSSNNPNRRISRDTEIEDEADLDSAVDQENNDDDLVEGEGEEDLPEEDVDQVDREGETPFDENDEDVYEMRGDDGEPLNSNEDLGQIASASDDSIMNGLIEDDLSEMDRIDLVNKTNSNTNQPDAGLASPSPLENNQSTTDQSIKSMHRAAKKAANTKSVKSSIRRVSLIATELKRDHPHLSNLNPDEQLSGKLSYIIKPGQTTIGKDDSCDIILHGLDIRANHARLIYENTAKNINNNDNYLANTIYIEPIIDKINEEKEVEEEEQQQQQQVTKQRQHQVRSARLLASIFVNGVPVRSRTELHNCDRLLFGTNVYFVFINNHQSPHGGAQSSINGEESNQEEPLAPDSITYDMAKAEVLKNIMMKDEVNNSIVRDLIQNNNNINKENIKKLNSEAIDGMTLALGGGGGSRNSQGDASMSNQSQFNTNNNNQDSSKYEASDSDDGYSERIRLDTAELAWQLEEVNKIAEEMDIKLEYDLCVLTGAEQLIAPIEAPNFYELGMFNDGMNNSKFSQSSSPSSSKSSSVINGLMDTSRVSSSIQSDTNNKNNNMVNDNNNGDENSATTLTNANGGRTSAGSAKTIADLNKLDASIIPAAVYVRVRSVDLDIEFYWSKDKFIDRRFKIQDLYGVYSFDNGGKQALISYLIEQSSHQLLIDPFFDDPRTTYVLIGHVQLILQPLSHLVDIDQEYDIISVNDDQTSGSISIQAIPCHGDDDKHYPFTSRELEDSILDDPSELIGRKLAFMLKINSCHQIPDRYTSIYCQYMLHLDSNVVRTDFVSVRQPETQDIVFNHVHYITFKELSQETLDILRYGTMTIQVVGRYNYNEINTKPISTVFAIVNSINKHRAKFNRQQQNQQQQQHHSGSSLDNQLMMRGNGGPISLPSKSGASSTVSSAMMIMDESQQGDDDVDDGSGQSQENIIDVILTKRKLNRAENQLHYLKRTVNIAEHYNKKHIPVKTVKKLLSSYGHELNNSSFDELADVTVKKRSQNDSRTCTIS